MAHDDDSELEGPRRRDQEGHYRRHKKRRSREHSSKRATSASEGTSRGSGQRLSMNALAQLNEYNTRGVTQEPAREREHKPKRDRPRREAYEVVDVEYESPRRERRTRDDYRHSEGEYDTPRRERRRRKEEYREEERGYESRDREDRRRRRRHHVTDTEDDEERPRERERRHRKKDRRVVSGAIVEEGRASPEFRVAGMRGGAASKHSSYDSYDSIAKEKEGSGYSFSMPVWKKKKRCKFRRSYDGNLVNIVIRDNSWCCACGVDHHYRGRRRRQQE